MHARALPLDRCRWVPWAIVAAFVVIIAVNSAFAYYAIHTDPGLVTEHPFESGNGYNRVIDAEAAQDALGWHGRIAYAAAGVQGGTVAIDLADRTGEPLVGLSVTAQAIRPLGPGEPPPLAFSETAPGHYASAATFVEPGQWEIRAIARRANDVYQFEDRIIVR